MRRALLLLVLASCKSPQPVSSATDARLAASSSPQAASVAAAERQDGAVESHADESHAPAHHHGAQGYHMDFSEVERFAQHFDSPDRDAWQKPNEVVRLSELRAGQVVADIGAGTGYFLSHWSKAVGPEGRVLALDVEPNMVEYMKRRGAKNGWGNVEARVVAPDDPGLPDGGVDRIVIVDTWHHIDDRSAYASKLARALRSGGFVLVVDFTRESDMGPPAAHRLPPEQVVRELEGGGLRAHVVAGETLPKQYVVRADLR
jgi:SAM-dependent methyltransferase